MDFSTHPVGIDFRIFGPAHLVALAIIAAINVAFFLLRGRLGEGARKQIRIALALILVTMEVSYEAWRGWAGLYTLQDSLPLHLCSVMSFVVPAMLLTRNQTLYELVYFLGIGGAAQALFTPDIAAYGYPHLRFFSSFVSHGGIVTAALYMTMVEGRRPSWRSIPRAAGIMVVYMAVIEVVNFQLGSNYVWIARKPDFPSLIDQLGPWPWYILSLGGVGLISMLVLYLPFIIRDRLAPARSDGC